MSDAAAPASAPRHTARRMARNTVVLAIGRNLVALSRLVVVVLITRQMGAETFAEYALLIALLTVAEGVLDFGSTEVYVREILGQPARRQALLRLLSAGRLVQIPLAFGLVVALAVGLHYPVSRVEAAAVGGISLAFLGLAMVYRAVFRADLTMERDVAAELASVAVMVAGVLLAVRLEAGILGVMLAHVASRAVYALAAAWLGRASFRLSIQGVTRADLAWSARACWAIGIAGMMVMLYDPLDILLLSHFGSLADVARYSAAQRLSWPVLMALSAVGGTLYSVLATAWPGDRERFARLCQRGVDAVLVLGGAAAAALMAGAEFLLGILGPALVEGSDVLRVLSVLVVVKGVSMTVGPTLLIMHAQRAMLTMIGAALVLKLLVLAWVVPRYGALGVAWSALAIDSVVLVLPVLVVTARATGMRLHPGVALRVMALCGVSVALARWAFAGHAVLPLLAAPALYAVLAVVSRTVRWQDFRELRSAKVAVPAATA